MQAEEGGLCRGRGGGGEPPADARVPHHGPVPRHVRRAAAAGLRSPALAGAAQIFGAKIRELAANFCVVNAQRTRNSP